MLGWVVEKKRRVLTGVKKRKEKEELPRVIAVSAVKREKIVCESKEDREIFFGRETYTRRLIWSFSLGIYFEYYNHG